MTKIPLPQNLNKMPQQEFVVRFNETSDMYLTFYSSDLTHCLWGNLRDAIIYSTLAAAQSVAASIGGGTVGTPKPH